MDKDKTDIEKEKFNLNNKSQQVPPYKNNPSSIF